MIAPHKRTPVFTKWKEIARRDYGLDIHDDRPFAVFMYGTQLRVNTKHGVVIALEHGDLRVWNKPLQCAGKPLTLEEMIQYKTVLVEVWRDIEGELE